jgi:flagellar biosynthetic protein FliR
MLPICGFLVAINLAVGVISRSSPQMNLFAVGFPITMIVIFILLYMFVDSLAHSLTGLSQKAVEHLENVLGVMANG